MRDITHRVLAYKNAPKNKKTLLRFFLPVLLLAFATIGTLRMSTAHGAQPISASVDLYSQCANDLGDGYPSTNADPGCQWTNGNLQHNNSTYHEGDATPQRLAIQDLTNGSHTITFSYDTTKSGKHAYDFLTDDKFSENWISNADMCDPSISNFASCSTSPPVLSGVIPTDSNAAGHDLAVTGRHFTIRNGTWANTGQSTCGENGLALCPVGFIAGPKLASGTYASDSETTIQLKFNVDTTTCANKYQVQGVDVCEVLITFGAHISTQQDWGTGTSAVNISGSPYHVALVDLDGSSIGQRDNQMQAGAIAQTPVITTELHNDADNSVIANNSSLNAGVSIHDKATVAKTGNSNSFPTGTVTFRFYSSSSDCTSDTTFTGGITKGTITLVSGVADPSTSTGALVPGTYAFKAMYNSSDISTWTNAVSTCEPFTINQGTSQITTTLKDSSNTTVTEGSTVSLGTIMHDSATVTLTPSAAPTGNVSFRFYNTVADCTADTTFAGGTTMGTVALDGNNPGVANPSTATSALGAGTYAFKANWPGNTNYQGATSSCETFTVGQGSSTVTTTLHKADHSVVTVGSSVPLGTVMHDLATVAVTPAFAAPSGNVDFTFYSNGTCDGTGTASGSIALDGSTPGVAHPSTSTSALTAGSYSFKATWGGDTNYTGNTSSCENFTVSTAQLGITTTIHDVSHAAVTSVDLGSVVHDTATISGQVGSITPTGAVTFTFYTSNDCTTGGSAVTTTSDSTDTIRSVDTSALAAGSYSYSASVASDTNYAGATADCEPLTVNKAQLTTATNIHDAAHTTITTASLGDIVHDTASISGGVGGFTTPAITFTFYTNGTCTGDGSAVSNTGADEGDSSLVRSANSSALGAGSYSYKASVSGNSNYLGDSSDCEPLTVGKVQLGIATTVHSDSPDQALSGHLALGSGAHDSASVTGKVGSFTLPNVTFYFFNKDATCTNGETTGGTELNSVAPDGVTGVAHPSNSETSLAAGTYNFMAVVASDDNYTGATSDCEPFTVDKAQLGITTHVHDANHTDITNTSVDLGTVTHDTATITGAVSGFTVPAVSFTFTTSYTNSCASGTAVANSSNELSGDYASVDSSALGSGTYAYRAVVAGDDNYIGATGTCEPFTVNQATPTVVTEIHNAAEGVVTSVDAGTTVHDKATVTGGIAIAPTGSVSFTFFSNGTCDGTGTAAGSNISLVTGVAHPSTSEGPLNAGSYSFLAHYNGDTNYSAKDAICEPLTVNQLTPSISTTASAGGVVGVNIHDSATVTGGDNPTGSVTFYLFAPGDSCSDNTTALFSETDPLSSGSAGPTADYATLAVGTYHWKAVYSGDTNNVSVTSPCSAEPVTTIKATPSISTTPNPSSGTVGVVLNDTATVSGGNSPTGSVTFNLYSPSQASCTGTPAYTFTDTTSPYATTPGFTSNAGGTWRWTATYNGDNLNNSVTSGCSDEQVTLTQPVLLWCSPGFWATALKQNRTAVLAYLANHTNPPLNLKTFLYNSIPSNLRAPLSKKAPSSNPTLADVLGNPSGYGGPAYNSVADYIAFRLGWNGTQLTGENCPLDANGNPIVTLTLTL